MNIPSLSGNWIDLVILVVILFFVSEAIRVGFWIILADFLSFLLSLLIALRGYQFASSALRANFSLSHSISNALGFLFMAVIAEGILGVILSFLIRKIPYRFWKGTWSKIAAVAPGIGEGLILASFILTLVLAFPLDPRIKNDITGSAIGSHLVKQTSGAEAKINEIFGGVVEDALTFLTVKPESREVVPLSVDKRQLTVDEASEQGMLNLVNEGRKKMGIKELAWEPKLAVVARAHATDMWERSYFGHVSPEGEDVGNRLDKAGIRYQTAGENLALAPTLTTAHNGLMNSEGHRANILDADFNKIGIGVIDNGVYGKMFVQVFAD
jgi:uncharacterized protein YkwD/uncharacterized membrane protein required for colicin V production